MSHPTRDQFVMFTKVSFVPCCVAAAEDTDVNSRSPAAVHGAGSLVREPHLREMCRLTDAKYCGDSAWVIKWSWDEDLVQREPALQTEDTESGVEMSRWLLAWWKKWIHWGWAASGRWEALTLVLVGGLTRREGILQTLLGELLAELASW